VCNLEALKAIAALSFTADDIQNLVDKLSTFGIMTLGPVVASTRLAENQVIRAEELTKGARTDGIHGTGLQIDENGARDILITGSLVEVDLQALELEVGGSIVHAITVKAVLARDGLPERSANLVTTLAGLEVNNLAHDDKRREFLGRY